MIPSRAKALERRRPFEDTIVRTLAAPLRVATPDDAPALAELINFAGEGLPLYLWRTMAAPGEDAWAVGRRRARREEGSFSYRNAIVVEADDGRVAACLIGYPLPDTPEAIDYEQLPAMFIPLQELENLAAGTWYVNVVAAFPEYRGRGYGTKLLELAEQIAVDRGCRGLSLVVADTNVGARRLYERCGYREQATRPMVKADWETQAQHWLLLVKPIADSAS